MQTCRKECRKPVAKNVANLSQTMYRFDIEIVGEVIDIYVKAYHKETAVDLLREHLGEIAYDRFVRNGRICYFEVEPDLVEGGYSD